MTTNDLRITAEGRVGTPADIPKRLSSHCDRYLAEDVLKRLDHEALSGEESVPGKCRMCGKQLPIAFSHVDLGGFADPLDIPLVQCNRIMRLYPEVERIREQRKAEAIRRKREMVEDAQAGRVQRNEGAY